MCAFDCVPFTHLVDRRLLVHDPTPGLVRLGSRHDGGYVVSREAITMANHLLSFGVATNWDFEKDAVALNPRLTVDAYDPSVNPRRFAQMAVRSSFSVPLRALAADFGGARKSLRRVRTAIDYFRFFSGRVRHTPQRVWYNGDRGSMSIKDILANARLQRRVPMFAKIDIEGSEYRILPWIIESADLFTGLAIEFHHTDICAEMFNEQVGMLLESFRVAHIHGNNYGDLSIDGALPLSLEISFIHRSLTSRSSGEVCASVAALDSPNDPCRPDYQLDLRTDREPFGPHETSPRRARLKPETVQDRRESG